MGRVPVQPERVTRAGEPGRAGEAGRPGEAGRADGARAVVTLTDRAVTVSSGQCRGRRARREVLSKDLGGLDGLGVDRDFVSEVIAWDFAGRLYSVWRDGRTCRRGLGGRILQKWHERGVTRRRWLDAGEADALVDDAAASAAAALEHATAEQKPIVARAAAFDAAAARRDAERFSRIYADIGILPPDQYLAVVVQATEGCSFRTCEFCDLFDRPYRVKPAEEFDAHVAAVREYMGDSLRLRGRSAFIGAANALALPVSRLEPYLATIRARLGAHLPIAGFVDGHTGAVKSASDYRRLAAAGLGRVYVGLESGDDELLAVVRKPSRAAETIATVAAMKAAGLSVAVIVMLGLGGTRFADAHAAHTAAALNRMPLGRGDLVYFSDLVVPSGGRYAQLARDAGLTALDEAARTAQKSRIRSALRFDGAPPQIATYDIREFVY